MDNIKFNVLGIFKCTILWHKHMNIVVQLSHFSSLELSSLNAYFNIYIYICYMYMYICIYVYMLYIYIYKKHIYNHLPIFWFGAKIFSLSAVAWSEFPLAIFFAWTTLITNSPGFSVSISLKWNKNRKTLGENLSAASSPLRPSSTSQ